VVLASLQIDVSFFCCKVGKEKDRLGGAPIAQEKDNGVGRTKAVRTFLSAMRAYHTKCAKQFDELLKGEESSQVISTSPAAGSNSSASLPTVVGNSSTSLPTVVASPSSSSSSLPDVSASNIPAAFTGRPPPPLPARKTVSEADDPFSEQPLTPVEPSLIRARSKSNVMLGGGPPPPVVSAPPPSVSPPTSPRETGLATTPPVRLPFFFLSLCFSMLVVSRARVLLLEDAVLVEKAWIWEALVEEWLLLVKRVWVLTKRRRGLSLGRWRDP
jgi:hypothetical protein